jgi:phage gp29-like protein
MGKRMTPEAFRKQQERQRRKDAGLVRCEVWVKPFHVVSVRQYAERLKVWYAPDLSKSKRKKETA